MTITSAWRWLSECDAPSTNGQGNYDVSQTGNFPVTGNIVVESCPECGTVTDIEYGDEEPKDTFAVPFKTQEFMFEEMAEYRLDRLHDLIDDHRDLILEMARDRFRKGYAKFGSEMYSWSPDRRLDETLQELADAVVYPTSGSLA